MAKEKLFTREFLLCTFIYFFLTVFFFMYYTGMSTYAVADFGAPEWEAGLTASIFIVGDLAARLTVGQNLEKLGKRRVIIAALFLATGLSVMYLFIGSLPLLLIVRFFHGLAYGAASSAVVTTLALILPLNRRSEGMGYFMLSMSLGSAIGPLICMHLLLTDAFDVIFEIGIAAILIATIIALFLRDVPAQSGSQAPALETPHGLARVFERTAIPISVVTFVFFYAYSGVLTFMSPYGADIGLAGAATWFFVAVAVATLIARLFLGRIADRRGENCVLIPVFLLFILGMLLLAEATDGTMLLSSGFLIGLNVAMLVSVGQVIAIRRTTPNRYGKATATFNSFLDLAYAVGPVAHGLAITICGYRDMYLLLTVIGALSLVLYLVLHAFPQRRARRIA